MARTAKGKKKVFVRGAIRTDTGTKVRDHYRSTPNPRGAKHEHRRRADGADGSVAEMRLPPLSRGGLN